MPFTRGARTLVALIGAMTILLAGCSAQTSNGSNGSAAPSTSAAPTQSQEPAAPVPAGFETYYEQEVNWSKCGGGAFSCAQVEAPIDWSDPHSNPTKIAVMMYKARGGNPMGTLLINPGGPGGSGIDLVGYAPSIFGSDLLENYNILGFDPRGVGQSDPIKCLDAEAMDRYLAASFPEVTEETLPVMQKMSDEFAQACEQNSSEVLGHVDTQSAARDMDLLRAVVGDSKFNYLGFSYGTQLGATYAGIFPNNVGRMVLDGAIDLRLTQFEQSKQQAVGFENAFRAFLTDCLAGSQCPVTGTVDDAAKQVQSFLTELATNPLPTQDNGRVLTQSLAFYGLAQPLYAQPLWPMLKDGLTQAMAHRDGTALLALSDSYFNRSADGTYADNQTEAFTAINCLDSRGDSDFASMQQEANEIAQAAPTMGQFFAFGEVGCKNWPFEQVKQDFDLSAKGAPPIMVIGTTNDPATPYSWAQGLADQLDSGFLVTHVGEGHTAYGMGSTCIMNTVDEYFVHGTVPSTDPKCS